MASRIPGPEAFITLPIAVGGRVYLTARSGTIVVFYDANDLEIVRKSTINEAIASTPAPANNELPLRGERRLLYIAECKQESCSRTDHVDSDYVKL